MRKREEIKHLKFNPTSEARRLIFVICRDGTEAGLAYAVRMKTVYVGAALGTRKTKSRNHPFRYKYVEAAYSLRHLHRLVKNIPDLTIVIAAQLLKPTEGFTFC